MEEFSKNYKCSDEKPIFIFSRNEILQIVYHLVGGDFWSSTSAKDKKKCIDNDHYTLRLFHHWLSKLVS